MNNFEIILLALALVFNSWIAYINAGIVLSGESLVRKINYTGMMFLLQFMMLGAGIWIGYKTGSPEIRINMVISLSIMFIFGLKVLLTGIRAPEEDKAFDYTDSKVTFFASLAEGITPLAIGISIGLLSLNPYVHWIITGLLMLSGIVAALLLAKRMGKDSLKLRFGPVGGLLLLAAAIKLAINLIGF